MTDETPPPQRPERRFLLRYPAAGNAVVIRESDAMRTGIEGRLKDVGLAGVGILLREPLHQDESVNLVLRNEVQRVEKEVRGVVRHVTPAGDAFHIGIELFTRLTPLEVLLLRMGLPPQPDRDPGT